MPFQQSSQSVRILPLRNDLTVDHLVENGGEDQHEKQTDASKEITDRAKEESEIDDDDDDDDDDGRAHVIEYDNSTTYPFEVGDIVWIVKPEYRAPYGPFSIVKAHPDDKFELVKESDNSAHDELVEGKHLRRDD